MLSSTYSEKRSFYKYVLSASTDVVDIWVKFSWEVFTCLLEEELWFCCVFLTTVKRNPTAHTPLWPSLLCFTRQCDHMVEENPNLSPPEHTQMIHKRMITHTAKLLYALWTLANCVAQRNKETHSLVFGNEGCQHHHHGPFFIWCKWHKQQSHYLRIPAGPNLSD